MVKNINIDIEGEFRQCVLKLANTYKPKFELSDNFENQDELFDEFSQKLCNDFAEQLQPLVLEVLHKKM